MKLNFLNFEFLLKGKDIFLLIFVCFVIFVYIFKSFSYMCIYLPQ
jgi:hypothetical protein